MRCVTRLRETIHYLGKSVEEVAAEVGLGGRTLYSYISGKVVVPDELRAPLAKALDCTQEYLFPHPSLWLSDVSTFGAKGITMEPAPSQALEASDFTSLPSMSIAELFENIELLKASFRELQQKFAQGASTLNASHSSEDGSDGYLRLSRREALHFIINIPLAFSSLEKLSGHRFSSLVPEEMLPLYATAIPACWHLYYEGDVQHVERVLKQYVGYISSLAKESSPHQKQAATLASQGYKLANLLDLHHEDFGAALQHSKEALLYGRLAEDPNLQLAALIEEALTFFYRKRFTQTLETYRRALHLIADCSNTSMPLNTISPIIEGRVYAGLAVAYAQLGQKQEALRAIGLAQETFPEHPELDPHFAYTHYDHYYLYLYQGLMHMSLNQPEQALASYAHLNAPRYQARRANIANKEAAAFLALGDLDQCCATLEIAITLALSQRLDLRYSQAQEMYQGMLARWPSEEKVQHLSQMFQR